MRIAPATEPRARPLDQRLLHLDPRAGTFADARIADLPSLLRAGDLVVVNDAATLPASLRATAPNGDPVEVRLVAERPDGTWTAVLFGAGDWRTRTEDRPPPPQLHAGARLAFLDLHATISLVSDLGPRLVDLRFDRVGAALWTALYRLGRPVQYSYLGRALALSDFQTAYADRPWAAEAPSAGRPLRWDLLLDLPRRGIHLARLTHAAGLSSTGDPVLDAALPFPERFDIPAVTVAAVAATRAAGARVLAIGTTVVRALEGCAALHGGTLAPGAGETDLVIGADFRPRVVDGLFTGLHEPTASHFRLLEAFASPALLHAAWAHAEALGYLCHEFGDSALILPGARW